VQAAYEDGSVSSTDKACTEAQSPCIQQDHLLAQLSMQLAALQKSQTEAASASDVHTLHKQGALIRMPPQLDVCAMSSH
jgi:hypothetical protein